VIQRVAGEKLRSILQQAARLIYLKGYEGTSMQDIADACSMTKAGLYHHIATKEALGRLKTTMAHNVELVTHDSTKEVTIILHEHSTLTGDSKKEINVRKKAYVQFLQRTIEEAMASGQIRKVDATVAAFSFLGTVHWTYKWYRSDGALTPKQLSDGIIDLFFRGLEP